MSFGLSAVCGRCAIVGEIGQEFLRAGAGGKFAVDADLAKVIIRCHGGSIDALLGVVKPPSCNRFAAGVVLVVDKVAAAAGIATIKCDFLADEVGVVPQIYGDILRYVGVDAADFILRLGQALPGDT